jgi:hypothetical protein
LLEKIHHSMNEINIKTDKMIILLKKVAERTENM